MVHCVIESLPDYSLKKPIPIVIDSDLVVSWIDAHVHAQGETQEDAIENLKDMIQITYEERVESIDVLSRYLKECFQVMEEYIGGRR